MNAMAVAGTEADSAMANNDTAQNSTVIPVYTLTVTKSGNGSGIITSDQGLNGAIACGSTCSATFLNGTVVNVNTSPDPGSLFQSWGGACSGTPNTQGCSLTMDGNKSASATFVLGITLNVTISGGGTGNVTSSDGSISCGDTGGTCSSLNLPGTSVSLMAAPSGGSVFNNWSGACSGTNPNSCNITLNSNQTATANITPPLDFTVTPATTSLSVKRGGEVSEALTFPAQGGFSAAIALKCSVIGNAPMPTCGISPNSVTPGSNATLSVNTAGLSAALAPQLFGQTANVYAAGLPFGGFVLLLLTASFDKKCRHRWFLCVALLAATLLPVACGGGSSTPPPPVAQNYTVTVTATSGTITHSTNINVTVN
jgi:hypothetical protein